MDKILKLKLVRKALAIVLAMVVGLTFMPLLGSSAYAAVEDQTVDSTEVTDADVDTEVQSLDGVSPDELELVAGGDAQLAGVDPSYYSVNVSRSGNIATISGTVKSPYSFGKVFVDDANHVAGQGSGSNKRTINVSIDMTKYDIGYHTLYLQVYRTSTGNVEDLLYATQASEITVAPTYAGVYEVYSDYMLLNPYNMAMQNERYPLYLEYSADGGSTWSSYGYMQANAIKLRIQQQYKITGLAPNHNYITRLYYGKSVKYDFDGKTYFFRGPALVTGTYKTGMPASPSIKSVTCKAVKVKRHKHRVPAHYEWVGSSLIWFRAYTEKYYTYKVKITVKLKKKPGTAGLWINGTYCPGNKKKYTATFTPQINYSAKKPKGRKWGVVIASYQNSSYGGYSPLFQTTKKLK